MLMKKIFMSMLVIAALFSAGKAGASDNDGQYYHPIVLSCGHTIDHV